jgi:hypothetical protein
LEKLEILSLLPITVELNIGITLVQVKNSRPNLTSTNIFSIGRVCLQFITAV